MPDSTSVPHDVVLEGMFANDLLGIFVVIRGFANIGDLAHISTAYEMAMAGGQELEGHQRSVSLEHAERIKSYLELGDNRFLPEIILSCRTELSPIERESVVIGVKSSSDDGIQIRKKTSSAKDSIHVISISGSALEDVVSNRLIRRIDGNHRLALADQLEPDTTVPNKYLCSYCLILLGPPNARADDYAESLIFHTINSTALPLESEHALRLILGQDPEHRMSARQEFNYSPALFLTRRLYEQYQDLPGGIRSKLGEQGATGLSIAATSLLSENPDLTEGQAALESLATQLFSDLIEVASAIWPANPGFCLADYFVELTTVTLLRAITEQPEDYLPTTVAYLSDMARWLGARDLDRLQSQGSLADHLISAFELSRANIPKRVFLARWYPDRQVEPEQADRADLRLQEISRLLNELQDEHEINLSLIDLATEAGGTGPLHQRIYDAIESSDIILVDLTGHRPNVFVEAGFALRHHHKGKLLFLFEPFDDSDSVPFDLNTFRYERISQAAEILPKLKPHILEILRASGESI